MVVYYLSLDLPKTIINEAIQGGKLPAARRHHPLPRLRPFAPGVPARAVADLPRADRAQRLAQVPDQHHEGLDGRAHAAPPALRALRPHPALPALALPPRQGRRDGDHDQGRGRAARRLHRRGADHAAVPRRAGVDGDVLHPLPALGARPDRARGGGDPGGGDPASCASACWCSGRERQLTARALAGRIAETVDGAAEIHANGTSNYERAEISARLGRIFKIRFEFYQRKFLIKFLNNFLSQVTPFLFYTVGGYLVIMGRLDIGALVAVIAAYKDLPSPVKELIDWDQQRLDVEIKYQQVVEQFTDGEVAPPEMQAHRRCAAAAARGQAEGVEPPAGRRIGHQAGRGRVVRGRPRPARRHRRPAGRRRERARADARAPGAADQRLDRDGRRRHHARAGGADRPRHRLRRLAGVPFPGARARQRALRPQASPGSRADLRG